MEFIDQSVSLSVSLSVCLSVCMYIWSIWQSFWIIWCNNECIVQLVFNVHYLTVVNCDLLLT